MASNDQASLGKELSVRANKAHEPAQKGQKKRGKVSPLFNGPSVAREPTAVERKPLRSFQRTGQVVLVKDDARSGRR